MINYFLFFLMTCLLFNMAHANEVAIRSKNKSCGAICAFAKKAMAYPNSALSAARNKYCTGTWLTSTKAIDKAILQVKKKHDDIYGFKNAPVIYLASFFEENLNLLKRSLAENQKSFSYLMHAMTRPNYVGHSTLLVVGRNREGPYAMYLDPQGTAPSKATLFDQMADPKFRTVYDVYEALVDGLKEKPDLFYSSVQIQADFVSCTAYTALFITKVIDALSEKGLDNFDPEGFVRKFADDQIASFSEVRDMVP